MMTTRMFTVARLVIIGKAYTTSCCASLRSFTSTVFRPDSVQLLTAKKNASTADKFPKQPRIRNAISEQPIMYASEARVRLRRSGGARFNTGAR